MRKALIVGMEHYDNCKPLVGCIADANNVQELLSKNEDGSDNFICEKADDLTTRELTYKIRELFSQDLEIGLFYFSGHGSTMFGDEYICTKDSDEIIPGVKTSDILSTVNSSNCRNKIIILDSCFSGGMGHTSLIKNADLIGEGVTIITSSLSNQASGILGGRSFFTTLLCKALDGGAANLFGQITPGSIYAFIDKALTDADQRPVFKTNIKEFLTVRKVIQRISNDQLKKLPKLFRSMNDSFKLDPSYEYTDPSANQEHVDTFQLLQLFNQHGLVIPDEDQFMYYAAINSHACKLTPLGQYYWIVLSGQYY